MTDTGLAYLKGCRKLRHLDVRQAKVTEAGVKHLASLLTQCKLVHDGGVIEPK